MDSLLIESDEIVPRETARPLRSCDLLRLNLPGTDFPFAGMAAFRRNLIATSEENQYPRLKYAAIRSEISAVVFCRATAKKSYAVA
jgi:hypothetical protein